MKGTIVVLACAALLCGSANPARADTISITSGLLTADFTGNTINLVSDAGLNLVGTGGTFDMPLAFGFHAGQRVDFSATFMGLVDVVGSSTARMALLQLTLFAQPVSTPFGTFVNLQTPFTVRGTLDGASVGGGGTLALSGERVSSLNVSGITSAAYTFSPTPEPSSLLLLATGVIGVAARRLRRVGRQRD